MTRPGHPQHFAQHWKPHNLGGKVYYDPQTELGYWANEALGPMVAVPVETLYAAAGRRECSDRLLYQINPANEESKVLILVCRQRSHHEDEGITHHSTGPSGASWTSQTSRNGEIRLYSRYVIQRSKEDSDE